MSHQLQHKVYITLIDLKLMKICHQTLTYRLFLQLKMVMEQKVSNILHLVATTKSQCKSNMLPCFPSKSVPPGTFVLMVLNSKFTMSYQPLIFQVLLTSSSLKLLQEKQYTIITNSCWKFLQWLLMELSYSLEI